MAMKVQEIYLKVHESANERILAACDSEILGKKFSEGKLRLEVEPNFYNGSLTTLASLTEELPKATIVNLAGNNVVDFALENKFLEKSGVVEISGVKHAQIISL